MGKELFVKVDFYCPPSEEFPSEAARVMEAHRRAKARRIAQLRGEIRRAPGKTDDQLKIENADLDEQMLSILPDEHDDEA